MKISNLRLEDRSDKRTYLVADIQCDFTKCHQLWFCLDSQYRDWFSDDIYDAFLVTAIWPAMCYHEDIEIDGYVSKILFFHIKNYLLKLIQDFRPQYRIPSITIKGFKEPTKSDINIVGTGFSGGIDSFTTIYDRYENEKDPEYRINTLFFFNIGQNGNINDPNTAIRAKARYEFSKKFADSVNLPYLYLDSNMFDFYKPHWEYDAGPLCRVAAILSFQRVCSIYYLSSSYHYLQQKDFPDYHTFDSFGDSFIYYWLSTDNTRIILDGGIYTRPEKTEHIKDYAPIRKYLNVCVKTDESYIDTKNCSICHKCQRTLIALDSLGIMDEFREVFDIDLYKRNSKKFIAQQRLSYKSDPFVRENLIYAKKNGIKIPGFFSAYTRTLAQRIKNRLNRTFRK